MDLFDIEAVVDNPTVKKMLNDIATAAVRIKAAVDSNRTLLIRYHNDADGICSALAMNKAIKEYGKISKSKVYFYQNNGATYTMAEAIKDMDLLKSQEVGEKPMVILFDFGTNEESFESLSVLQSAKFETMIVDHHPFNIERRDFEFMVSPWKYEGGSEYCAGYLSARIASRIAKVEVEGLAKVALVADKSRLIEKTNELEKIALALDFSAVYNRTPNIGFYENLINDRELIESLYSQAIYRLANAVAGAKNYVKFRELENGLKICIVKVDKMVKKGEFPNKSKVCTYIHEQNATNEVPFVTIGHGEGIIMLRANRAAKGIGMDANNLIQELKKELKNVVVTGGGHDMAASMHINRGHENLVLDEVMKKLECLKI